VADRFALLVGSYEYAQEPGLQSLRCPPNDIASLETVLSDPQIGGFVTQTSINESFATVLERVEDFLADRSKDEVALLYFSGHGIKADGELYFALANTRLKRLLSTALKARTIQDALRACRARQQLLLLDCCYSGAVPRGMVIRNGGSVGTHDYFDGRGHVVLTASDAVQYAFEEGETGSSNGETPQSIFTRALVDGLSSGKADRDGDGIITADELYDHLHEQIRLRTPGQTPCKWAMDQQGQLIVAHVPITKASPSLLPEEFIDTIEDRRHWIRLSAVGELVHLLLGNHKGRALAARNAMLRLLDDDSRLVSNAAAKALLENVDASILAPLHRPNVKRPIQPAPAPTTLVIPRHRVTRKLGQGTVSSVYLAIQEAFDREVAVKIMSPFLASDAAFSTRFWRVAAVLAHIHHSSIVPVIDLGTYQGCDYLCMEYLPGGDLRKYIATSGYGVHLALKVCKAISSALDLAHRKGFVHRNIKPENILFREDGTPVLTDFGIAWDVANDTDINIDPSYMSPEQVKGIKQDGRSDLYSMGVVFYEMLTGLPPFTANSAAELALKHLNEPIPNLPSELTIYQSFLDRLTAKDRDERFTTGAEVITRLHAIAELSGVRE